MKIFIFLLHVSYLLANFIKAAEGNYAPLTLYLENDYYEVQDFKTVQSKVQNERSTRENRHLIGYNQKFQALLCCPPDTEADENEKLIHVVQKLVYNKNDMDEAENMCNKKLIPSRRESLEKTTEFADYPTEDMVVYEIGYEVCDKNNLISEFYFGEVRLKQNNETCDFFSKLEILFDDKHYRTYHTRYELTYNANSTNQFCKEGYNIDRNWDREKAKKIKHFYSPEKQSKILKNIILSSIGFSSSPGTGETWGEQVQENRQFLVAQYLAPREDFHNEVYGDTACSYLNKAPMWASVAKTAWETVENVIRNLAAALFREIKLTDTTWYSTNKRNKRRVIKSNIGKLSIITGTHGVLRVRSLQNGKLKEKYLYLLQDDSISLPVPERFWKLVMYEVPRAGNAIGVRYGIFLVTDNANSPLGNDFCEDDICTASGWDIVNLYHSTYTYCCAVNERNWRIFGVSLSRFPLPIKVLNLNSIWTRNVDGKAVEVNVFQKLNLAGQSLSP